MPLSDIEIARQTNKRPIKEVAKILNHDENSLYPFGHFTAKINFEPIKKLPKRNSKLILVTAITPTPAGEGKTTTSVGLNDGL